MFLPQEIIIKKRNKKILVDKEISDFIKGITGNVVSDAQIAAFTMAVFLNGMNKTETVALTKAMAESGTMMKWSLGGPVVDKHSTGGVGDKVSLMLAPMLAACGCYVPMISGRGLGHTGGTADKLEAIKGYNVFPDIKDFKKAVKSVGCAIIGQTADLAPADKRIYAVRDISGTVENISLITASILAKKLAEGLDTLVMDLKTGNGAFMRDIAQARELAKSIVSVANGAGTKTRAIITDMNQVLGSCVGNALEIKEAVDYLSGKNREGRLHSVTMGLCAEVLLMQKMAKDKDAAYDKLQKVLDDGSALEKWAGMLSALGAPADFTDKYEKYLPKAKVVKPVYALKKGYVQGMDVRAIGLSVIGLKGGRINACDKLDFATGYTDFCQIGDVADNDKPIAVVHAQSESDYQTVKKILQDAVKVGAAKPKKNKILYEVIK